MFFFHGCLFVGEFRSLGKRRSLSCPEVFQDESQWLSWWMTSSYCDALFFRMCSHGCSIVGIGAFRLVCLFVCFWMCRDFSLVVYIGAFRVSVIVSVFSFRVVLCMSELIIVESILGVRYEYVVVMLVICDIGERCSLGGVVVAGVSSLGTVPMCMCTLSVSIALSANMYILCKRRVYLFTGF